MSVPDPSVVDWVPIGGVGGSNELAYAELTSVSNVTATSEATAQIVVAAPAISVDGNTKILVEFCAEAIGAAAGGNIVLYLRQDGVSIGPLAVVSASGLVPVRVARRLTPAAGSRTYAIHASVSTGTGSVIAGAGGLGVDAPAFIRITRA